MTNNSSTAGTHSITLFVVGITLFLPIWGYPFLENAFQSNISKVFGFIVWGMFILSSVNWGASVNWGVFPSLENKISNTLKLIPYPTLFLLAGISGTFIGIYNGLTDLQLDGARSIGTRELTGLISGLTFSFTTSIAGIAATFFYRLLESVLGTKKQAEAGAAEIIQAIDKMGEKLDTFIQKLQEEVVNGLSDALQGLVSNLEEIVSDQLGQAFRELNSSIIGLNEWVLEYRKEVSTLTEAYKSNLIGMDDFREKVDGILTALRPLPEYMAGIDETLKKVNMPLQDFADLGTRARDAVTQIETNLTKSSELSQNVSESQTKMSDLSEALKKNNDDLEKLISNTTKEHLESFAKKLASISEKFAQDYTPIAEKLNEVLRDLDTRKRGIPDE